MAEMPEEESGPVDEEKNDEETENYFDGVIGLIEDIVMESDFQELQRNFLESNWEKFENSDENKLIYMDIFKEYTMIIESYIVDQLNKRMEGFDMNLFAKELQDQRHQLDGEIFDLLLSLLDFVVFKDMILDYKAEKEGKFNNVLGFGITVTKISDSKEED